MQGDIYVDSAGRYRSATTGRYVKAPTKLSQLTDTTLQSIVSATETAPRQTRQRASALLNQRLANRQRMHRVSEIQRQQYREFFERDLEEANNIIDIAEQTVRGFRENLEQFDTSERPVIGGALSTESLDFFWQLQLDRATDLAERVIHDRNVGEQHVEDIIDFAQAYVAQTGIVVYAESEYTADTTTAEIMITAYAESLSMRGM